MEKSLLGESIAFPRAKIKAVAEKLLQKTSIKAVSEHIDRLKLLSSVSYYDNLSVLDYEKIRDEIRELAKFVADNQQTKAIFVNFEDKISTIDVPIDAGNPSPADNFEEYKKKVNFYLSEHLNDEAIKKLRTNQKLTKEDFARLEHIFKDELGSEKMFSTLTAEKSLGVFIRSVTKMDKSAINTYFADFINDANMNALQIQFVQKLIDIIVEQGEVNIESLMKGRAPFDRLKFFTLFGEVAQKRIYGIIHSINENAKVAA